MDESAVQFSKGGTGKGLISATGALAGLGIAVGTPWVLLEFGQSLGPHVLTVLVVVALAAGGLVSLTAVFFGLVIPEHVGGHWIDPKNWKEWARCAQDWDRGEWEGRRGPRAARRRPRHGFDAEEA